MDPNTLYWGRNTLKDTGAVNGEIEKKRESFNCGGVQEGITNGGGRKSDKYHQDCI